MEFAERRGEKIFDMEAVRKQIDEDTEKVAGKNKSISNVPLRLRFYSKNVVDLLLVDLPGMTKVASITKPDNIFLSHPNNSKENIRTTNQPLNSRKRNTFQSIIQTINS